MSELVPPRLRELGGRIVALRWWILGALAIGRGLIDGMSSLTPIDFVLFGEAGRTLLSSHWADAYSSSFIQTGVIQLAIHGGAGLLADALSVHAKLLFALISEVGVTVLIVAATRRAVTHIRGDCPGWLELVVGLVVLIGETSWTAYISGHPSDIAVAMLWIAAAVDARESRTARAGVWLALSAGFKQWGLLGAPILLLGPRNRSTLMGFGVQVATTALMYAPFFLFGDVNTFDKEWTVASLSLPRLFLAENALFPWWMRLVQGAFVVSVGAIVANLMRKRSSAVWVVPAILILARLLSEPFGNYYHWSAFDVIALVGVASLLLAGPMLQRVAIGAGLYVQFLALYLPGWIGFFYRLAFAAVLIAVGTRRVSISSTTPVHGSDSG
jgi:hypothetical protein